MQKKKIWVKTTRWRRVTAVGVRPILVEKCIFSIVHLRNLALHEYSIDVHSQPPTESKLYCCPLICTMGVCACFRMEIERGLSCEGL